MPRNENENDNFDKSSGDNQSGRKGPLKYSVIYIVLGAIGLACTGFLMIRLYRSTSSIRELLVPLMYYFIPFLISFFLLRFGINQVASNKR